MRTIINVDAPIFVVNGTNHYVQTDGIRETDGGFIGWLENIYNRINQMEEEHSLYLYNVTALYQKIGNNFDICYYIRYKII